MNAKAEPVSQKGESDLQQRIGTSPRLVGSVSVYLQKNGQYHVNMGTMAGDQKPYKGKNMKEVLAQVGKFLTAELDKDQWAGEDDNEE
jgi:hypothetical protein